MHLRCAKKAYSCSLEFCLGGFYNKRQLVFCPVLFLRPQCACCLSLVCVLFCVISLVISNNISNLRYADDTTLMAESEEELMSLLMEVKEESEKVGLKLDIQEAKIMASGPITSWEIDGETVKTVSDFIYLGSKITADGDCSHDKL